jgi:hypothetical protein
MRGVHGGCKQHFYSAVTNDIKTPIHTHCYDTDEDAVLDVYSLCVFCVISADVCSFCLLLVVIVLTVIC